MAKRYIAETGSSEVLAVCARADSVVVAITCLPELVSALARLVREKKLPRRQYPRLKSAVMGQMQDADVCQITPFVLDTTIALLERYSLRAMDALQVGCALAAAPDVFVSADHRQLVAARSAGLEILDVS